jgi:uncharacterized membrane protein
MRLLNLLRRVRRASQLCGLSSDRLMAVDLTWAPSTDGKYLARDELAADYSNLRPLRQR